MKIIVFIIYILSFLQLGRAQFMKKNNEYENGYQHGLLLITIIYEFDLNAYGCCGSFSAASFIGGALMIYMLNTIDLGTQHFLACSPNGKF